MSSTTSFTYISLTQALADWLEDDSDEFVLHQNTIINLGESRLASDLNMEIFDAIVTGALTPSTFTQSIKGAGWQGTRSLFIRDVGGTGPRRFIQRKTYEYCQDYSPDETVTAEPLYFAELTETDVFMVPAPDVAYGFELRQMQAPDSLSDANQETWLSTNAGDLLLYACLIASENFLKSSQEDVMKWKQSYGETMEIRRVELREQIRADYTPVQNAARTVEDKA